MDSVPTFTLGTLNVKATPRMRRAKVRADVYRAAQRADVILWQEIRPDYYKEIIFGHPLFDTYVPPAGYGEPISWRTDMFTLVRARHEELHPAVRGIQNRRAITWVVLRHKDTGRIVVAVNSHFVAHAFSAALRWRRTRRKRRELWDEGERRLKRRLSKIARNRPHAVVVGGGDFNFVLRPELGMNVRYLSLRARGRVDHLYALAREPVDYVRWTREKAALKAYDDLYTDHAMLTAAIPL